LPQADAHDYFRTKIAADLVLLTDTAFSHFVRHATVVEAHVRINNDTGTAENGGLFYTENLPPESLLAGLVMASVERQSKKAAREQLMGADEVLSTVLDGLCSGLLQVGGDATTGRGLVAITAMGVK